MHLFKFCACIQILEHVSLMLTFNAKAPTNLIQHEKSTKEQYIIQEVKIKHALHKIELINIKQDLCCM